MAKADYFHRKIEKGLCVDCGKPLDRDGARCKECQEKSNDYDRKSWTFYQSGGICPRCRKNEIIGDEKTCFDCREKARLEMQKLRNRDIQDYNSKMADYHKTLYWKRKEQGICTACGKRKAVKGKAKCGICQNKENEKWRLRHKPKLTGQTVEGLCYYCSNPVKEGYKVCEIHYQRSVDNTNSQKCKEARIKLIKEGVLY